MILNKSRGETSLTQLTLFIPDSIFGFKNAMEREIRKLLTFRKPVIASKFSGK